MRPGITHSVAEQIGPPNGLGAAARVAVGSVTGAAFAGRCDVVSENYLVITTWWGAACGLLSS